MVQVSGANLQIRTELTGNRLSECAHAATERTKRGWLALALAVRWFRARLHCTTNHAAVVAFPFFQRGKCGAQAELFGIARIHSGNKRRDQIFENFVPKLPAHESGHGFFFARRAGAVQRLGNYFPARARAQQGTGEDALRRHGHLLQFAVAQHVARRARIGLAKLAFDAKLSNQIEKSFGGLKTLRPGLEEKSLLLAILPESADETAGTLLAFEQRHRNAELLQPPGAGKPGNSSADHGDVIVVGHFRAIA